MLRGFLLCEVFNASSIQTCTADFFGVNGSGVGNIQFNSYSGQVTSTDSSADLTGTTVEIIARVTSTMGATDFVTLGSTTTDASGNFSRTNPVQSIVNFPNTQFASVQTFFGFTPFNSFNFDSSISECDSTDTSF